MPTRKQRGRRAKDFRHDVRVFEVDEEGNEVAISELRTRDEEKAPAKKATKAKTPAKKPVRGMKEVQPPSWRRSIKRGGLMGGALCLALIFLFKNGPIESRVAIGLFYFAAFIPMTYFLDRMMYRMYLKRSGTQPAAKSKPAKPAKS
jgi:hypothetical protein